MRKRKSLDEITQEFIRQGETTLKDKLSRLKKKVDEDGQQITADLKTMGKSPVPSDK